VSGWGLGGIAALGVFHGLNPAMGWLFAVGAGLQRESRRALALALPPIALGHLAAVGLALLAAGELQTVVSDRSVRVMAFAALAVFAWSRFVKPHSHGRWWAMAVRMRARELVLWSFLVSTAHGAGLMLLPFAVTGHVHVHTAATAALVHTAAMVTAAAAASVFVYEVIGVAFLRRGWVNLDRVWAYALGVGAVATLFLV
jgi:hypothetical protein